MAKYLGGTDSRQEEVKAELITPGLLSNDFVLNVSTGIFSSEKGALAGAILGGDNKTWHVVAAQLENGLRFVVQLDQDEFVKWVNLMPHKEAPSGEEV